MGPADGRTCQDIKADLTVAERNPWRNTTTPPRCRIEIGCEASPLDLERMHTPSLAICMEACHLDDNCRAVTYSYAAADNTTDNCWLKAMTSATRRTNDSANNVTWVSVYRPSAYAVAFRRENRTCTQVKEELSAYNDEDWRKQEPLCRVDFHGDVDLTRYYVDSLTACIDRCVAVPACKGLTFGYGAPNENYDNCWLKAGINSSVDTPEDAKHVMYVSLTKPQRNYDCFKDPKCKTGFALGTIGTVLGLMSTLGSMLAALARWTDDRMPNVLKRASSALGKTRQLSDSLMSIKSQKKGADFCANVSIA
ncbi:hypothetical protein OEZ86_009352 [Tetradesmus obliquus]|nr:hypothetical protein OEZ86_009352 [Tetradesmus obliquus]